MNEEEKKAIGLLEALNNTEEKCKIEKVPYNSEIKRIKISLLKEDYGVFRTSLNLIEKLQKENEELKADNYELNNIINDLLDNIPVQKVKDKIKEMQKEYNKLDEKMDEYLKSDNNKWSKYYENKEIVSTMQTLAWCIDSLQELIEESEEKRC